MKNAYLAKLRRLLLGFLFIGACLIPRKAQAAETQAVRVGFFEFGGYHNLEEESGLSGYGYDFLQLLARYSDLTYEYTGYEKSWEDMLLMLENGEIDLITSIRMTPERLERFAFSSVDIGSSATMITVKAGNGSFVTSDYSTYDGMRVGLLNSNSRNDSFADFAQEHSFTYHPFYFNQTEDLLEALAQETIDAAVTGNLRLPESNEWVLDVFDETPFYVAVRREDTGLLSTVNQALTDMDRYEGQWRTELYSRYYAQATSNFVQMNREEAEYFNSLKQRERVFQVLANPDCYPYSYLEDGNLKGILPDTFRLIAEQAGIEYQFIITRDRREYMEVLTSDSPDFCLNLHQDFSWAEELGYEISDPYASIDFSWLLRKDIEGSVERVAQLAFSSVRTTEWDSLYHEAEHILYESNEACVNALLSGEVDAFCTYTYHAEKVLLEDVQNRLQLATSFKEDDFVVGVSRDEDHCLLSVVNKIINQLDDTAVYEIINAYSSAAFESQPFSLIRLAYDYPLFIMLLIVFILFLAFMLIMQRQARAYRRSLEEKVEGQTKDIQEKSRILELKNQELEEKTEKIIEALSGAAERQDLSDGMHLQKVKAYSEILARQLMADYPEYGLTEDDIQVMGQASRLHDIGKLVITDSALLTRAQPDGCCTGLGSRSARGCDILLDILSNTRNKKYAQYCHEICRYHLERYDGKGYPDGISGEGLPISAQIVALADLFDARLQEEAHRGACSPRQLVERICGEERGAFSPKLLAAFRKAKEALIAPAFLTSPDEGFAHSPSLG